MRRHPDCFCDLCYDDEGHKTMNEQDMYRLLMFAGAVLTIISGAGAVVVLVMTATTNNLLLLIPTLLLAAVAVGSGIATVYFGGRYSGHSKVFSNEIEKEVLTRRQRRELRDARGGLVFERSLIEIEHERDNIVHERQKELEDPNRPPHQTRFGETP